MKTAISMPDDDFARFERVAARHGLTRSEFYRRAAARLSDELEGASELTALADAVLAGTTTAAGGDDLFLRESERIVQHGSDW